MLDLLRSRARRVVEAAGATYSGEFEVPGPAGVRLVLFTSKRTGSTLALDVHQVVAPDGLATVKAHLAESDARFGLPAESTT